jgi:small conductance mechanosensitive channel
MNFFQTYKEQIIYIVVVLVTMVVLHLLTKFLHKWLVKRSGKNLRRKDSANFNLIKHLLNALWLVLGAIIIFYLSTPEDSYTYDALTKDFKLTAYLGLVAVGTLVTASTTNMWFKQAIEKRQSNLRDVTNLKFYRYICVSVIYLIGLIVATLAFPSLRGIAQTALGGAGVIALVIGIASQEAIANVVGGIFIITFKPFKIGDRIELADNMVGTVRDISLRHTVIRSFENKMFVIPNSIINKEKLINYDLYDLKCCERIEIGISYDSDIDLAKRIMQEECESHPLILDNRTLLEKEQSNPVVKTAVVALNDFSVTIRAWAWVRNFSDSYMLRNAIYENVKKRFDKEGVEIPFYKTLVMKNTENKK